MMPSRSKSGRAPSTAPDISILGSQLNLLPGVEDPQSNRNESHDRNLVEHMPRFRESPLDFLRELSLHVSGTGWRSYDDVVGQPIFYSGYTENIKAAVMATPMLNEKISELAEKRINIEVTEGILRKEDGLFEKKKAERREQLEGALREVAEKMTDQMVCKMESKTFIRSAYYMCTALLTRAYHQGIHVSSEEVLRLRSVAEKAAAAQQSIVFLPCHRSHIDYVSLQLICYRLGLALPIVVAGDNLNFPLVGPFLQHAGAMWIRRSFGDDQLYITLLQSYIDTLLQKGFNFECFIEGGRSRIGKLLPPKFGILSFLLDSVLSGRVDDAIVVPVSTQYDKVLEVDSYVSELLGTPKQKENLKDFLSASSVLSLKLGRVDVRFHEPWSLKGFIQEQEQRLQNLSQSQQTALQRAYDNNLRTRLLRTLGYKVLADINAASVAMPTSLIGTVLLTLRGRGVGKSELIRRVDWLGDRVRAQGGKVAHFAGLPTSTVVERGLEVLGPNLVGSNKNLAEETFYASDTFQLSFYRNMIIHLFVSEALVAASMYTAIKVSSATQTQSIEYQDLVDHVSFLSQLFRGEFIFPTVGLTANLAATLGGLERDNVVKINRSPITGGQMKSAEDNRDIASVELSVREREIGRENFDFYCFLLWPFIEASWLGAVSLLMLTPPNNLLSTASVWVDDKVFQAQAQFLGKTLFAQGDLSYFEAVNKETLKNAFSRFEEEGVILVNKPPREGRAAIPQVTRLADAWMPQRDADGRLRPEGRLWEFCEEISEHRLEGKNRRDGDVVINRLLRLVETASADVWKKSPVISQEIKDSHGLSELEQKDSQARREKRRRAPFKSRANL